MGIYKMYESRLTTPHHPSITNLHKPNGLKLRENRQKYLRRVEETWEKWRWIRLGKAVDENGLYFQFTITTS